MSQLFDLKNAIKMYYMFHYQQKVNKITLKLYKHWREYEFLKKKKTFQLAVTVHMETIVPKSAVKIVF